MTTEPMSRGEAAIKATVHSSNGLSFDESGLPEEHRDMYNKIAGEVHDIHAAGQEVQIPFDYASDPVTPAEPDTQRAQPRRWQTR